MEGLAPHPLDLPRLRSEPAAEVLLEALEGLVVPPPSWDRPADITAEIALASSRAASDSALAHWLTRLVGSDLWWIEDDEAKEQIWSSASKRMAERCGRTAAPAMTRTFNIPSGTVGDGTATAPPTIAITLHEPPLTSDSMGLKTWASSYLLAKRLHHLVPTVLPTATSSPPSSSSSSSSSSLRLRALELGSGTGLVGLSAAALFGWDLHLTDLPEVVPNLTNNIAANRHLFSSSSASSSDSSSSSSSSSSSDVLSPSVSARVLDWTQPLADAYWRERAAEVGGFDVILASDPLYTPQHPELVVSCVALFLRKPATATATTETSGDEGGKFIIEHPLRPSHMAEVVDCEARLTAAGLVREAVGEEVGWDDWGVSSLQHERLRLGSGDADADAAEHIGGVRCRWSVWRWPTPEPASPTN